MARQPVRTLLAAAALAAVASQASADVITEGATRHWRSVDDFVREVSDARIWAGLHDRFATDVGVTMGRLIGDLAVSKHLPSP